MLLLLLLTNQLIRQSTGMPQQDNSDCVIFGNCADPSAKCLANEKYDPATDKCEIFSVRTPEPDFPPEDDCVTISNEISQDFTKNDQRTIKDCNRNKTCEDYADLGFECVPHWTCRTGVVITDGSGLIDLRGYDEDPDCCTSRSGILDLSDQKCKGDSSSNSANQGLNVCCRGPNFRVKTCTIKSNCQQAVGVTPSENTKGGNTPATTPNAFAECGRIVTNTSLRLTGLPDVRAVGGSLSQPGEFPHMCLVYRTISGSKAYVAGASLIAPNKVLSAAHKFFVQHGKTNIFDIRSDKSLYVRCGEHNVKLRSDYLESQDSHVEQLIFAPDYNEKNVFHNLVILVTKENFLYQPHISPVCLPSPGEIFDRYTDCWSTGWGSEAFPDPNVPTFYSDVLRKVKLPMVNTKECYRQLKAHERFVNDANFVSLHDSWVCAGGEKQGVDTCKGDGGSPHICKKDGKIGEILS